MAETASNTTVASGADELIQVRVPLDDAAEAFAQQDAERARADRRAHAMAAPHIRNDFVMLAVVILIGSWIAGNAFDAVLILTIGIPVALVLLVLGIFRVFYVSIPEGASAIVLRGGKYSRTIGSGGSYLPPWLVISHLVTRREIPYDVPVLEAPTADDVRAAVDVLVTFRIHDPYKFVITSRPTTSTWCCRPRVRMSCARWCAAPMPTRSPACAGQDSVDLSAALNGPWRPYGVTIGRVTITYARPPEAFLHSNEARQLAVLQRAEQQELQALAQRRLADEAELERQRVVAQVARKRDELQIEVQQAEIRQRMVELDAAAEELSAGQAGGAARALPARRSVGLGQRTARGCACAGRQQPRAGSHARNRRPRTRGDDT